MNFPWSRRRTQPVPDGDDTVARIVGMIHQALHAARLAHSGYEAKEVILKLQAEFIRGVGADAKEVRWAYHVVGNFDYILQVEVADLPAYEDFHAHRLASLPSVGAVTSYVTMKTLSRTVS